MIPLQKSVLFITINHAYHWYIDKLLIYKAGYNYKAGNVIILEQEGLQTNKR